ncbi:MAG: cytochrome b/b6 domain-containing protein [Rhodocyclaceae bacterium]|nr:cytochrome b/b6 domain-containing protein [Rhodocyclaceae bacterium]
MCGVFPGKTPPPRRAYVWDLPTRLFHWALVCCVAIAFVTAKLGGNWMAWHGRVGVLIVALLVFRLAWGFVGPTYARFMHFLPTPRALRDYLQGRWQAQGHNPLGALSVFALLGVLCLQAGSGLFSDDDVAFAGYLAPLVAKATSDRLTFAHRLGEEVLLALVALHVGAIAFYALVKKRNLVAPMITGWAEGRPEESTRGGGVKPFLLAFCLALAAAYGASGAWLPPPPAPAAAEW